MTISGGANHCLLGWKRDLCAWWPKGSGVGILGQGPFDLAATSVRPTLVAEPWRSKQGPASEFRDRQHG